MKIHHNFIYTLILFIVGSNIALNAQNVPNLAETAPAGSVTTVPVHPGFLIGGADENLNYVRTFTPLLPITDASTITESSPASSVQSQTTYYNGSGSPMETVVKNFTGNAKRNLIVPYDNRRLKGKSYSLLPYASTTEYTRFPFADQKSYYATLYPGEGYTSFSADSVISTATERSVKSYAPGKSLIGQGKGKKLSQISNDANTIRIWRISANKTPYYTGYYNANELFGEAVYDEESGYAVQYRDKNGRVIYKSVLTDALYVTPVVQTYATTYYVYDDLGRLRYVLPPLAVEATASLAPNIAVSDDILNKLVFRYQFDSKGRRTETRVPGQGDFTATVYDQYQRIVMRQTPEEKAAGQWEITYYDKISRVIGTSLYNSTQDRAYWQSNIDVPPGGLTTSNILYYLAGNGIGTIPGETAVSGNTIMSYTYYDSYAKTLDNNGNIYNLLESTQDFMIDLIYPPGAETPSKSNRTQGLVTGTKVRILRSPAAPALIGDWKHTVNYYDDKGRVIGIASFDKMASAGQMDYHRAHFVSNQYDFLDRLILSKHTIDNILTQDLNPVHKELYKYEYEDQTGRFIKLSHLVDNGVWQVLATQSYDELGRPKRKVLGNYGEVQDLDYNIRNQLEGINKIYAETGNKGGESRSFGQSIKYDFGFTQKKYNGEVSGIVWRGASGNSMAYGYGYDLSGRLKYADYRKWEVNVAHPSGAWSNTWTDYSVSNLVYDVNGNIQSMKQRGMGIPSGGSSVVPVDMDRMKYVYETGSNRLARVEDTVTYNYNLGDFVNANVNTADYAYDLNGNLVKDRNKKIDTIIYTHFNKPKEIRFSNGNNIQYSYDDGGNKIYEIINNAVESKIYKYAYVGNFVYRNDSLQYSYTPVGRTVFDSLARKSKEEFFVKDHLGNVRSVVDVYTYPILEYLGTYEVASAGLESLYFDHHVEIAEENPSSTEAENQQAGRVNGSQADHRVGTALLMRVMAGDKVEMNVNSFYQGYNPGTDAPVSASTMLNSIVSTLTAGVGGLGGSESHNPQLVGQVFNGNNYTQFTNIVNSTTDPGKPKAYLNYILFSENMQIVGSFSGAFQANGNGTWSEIGTTEPMEIPTNGYLAVYLNGFSTIDVFFDQVVIRFSRGKLKEEAHYYPHGLPMGNIGFAASGFMPNRNRYQTNQNQTELGLSIMDFNFRQYDAQIGRFLSVDPLAGINEFHSPFVSMSNNPVSRVDPLGLDDEKEDGFDGNSEESPFVIDNTVVVVDGNNYTTPAPSGAWGGTLIIIPSGWRGPAGGILGQGTPSGGASGQGKNLTAPPVPGSPTGNSTNGCSDGIEGGVPDGDVNGQISDNLSPISTDPGITLGEGGIEAIHAIFDMLGIVPAFGEIFDLANAALYAMQGDYVNAALSGASAIPLAGYGATAIKMERRAAKAIQKIQKHHVVPNAVEKTFRKDLKAIDWKQNGGNNIKRLPTPFHGNHPAYNKYVTDKMNKMRRDGNMTSESMRKLQDDLRQEINDIYLNKKSEKLNDYYKLNH